MSWEEDGGVGNARKGYCRFGQVLGRDRGFLVVTEFSGIVLRQGFPVSRHGSQATGSCLVTT